MKRTTISITLILVSFIASAQTRMFINKTNGTADSLLLSDIKSITFKTYPTLPTQGLIAAWLFDGTAADASGNGNNGTVNGATLAADRFGSTNKAYSFAGNATIQGSTSSFNFGAGPFSISLWIKTNSTTGGGILTTHDAGSSKYSNVGIYIAGTNYGFADIDINNGAGSGTNFNGRKLTDNQWHHILVIRQGAAAKLYVDGILDFTDNLTQNPNNSTSFIISSSYNTAYFIGTIDDIRVYNRALSDAEIGLLYHESGW
jgi:hypothetical protein